MQPADAVLAGALCGNGGNRKRRGVGCQHRARRNHGFQLGKELLFDVEPLDDRLDNRLARGHRSQRARKFEPPLRCFSEAIGKLAFFFHPGDPRMDVRRRLFQRLATYIEKHDLEARSQPDLGNAGAHRPCAHNTQGRQLHRCILHRDFFSRTRWHLTAI